MSNALSIRKYISLLESRFPTNAENIHHLCSLYDIEHYTINSDWSIDVEGDVDFSIKKPLRIPLNFRTVIGNFSIKETEIDSLEGSPRKVDNFNCALTRIQSLSSGPRIVNGHYDCFGTELSSFRDMPEFVGGNFDCRALPIDVHDPDKITEYRWILGSRISGRILTGNRILTSILNQPRRTSKEKLNIIGQLHLYSKNVAANPNFGDS